MLENAGMVEQVDTQDLKSCESNLVRVRFPLLVQASLLSGAFFCSVLTKLSKKSSK